MASLIIANGKQEGNYYPLGKRTTVIGRDEALLVQILDKLISRKHMQIRYDTAEGRYLAVDMKSSNGVYINHQKISEETPLTDGDVITIGSTGLLFTTKDFESKDSALQHFKKVGERQRITIYEPQE